MTANDINTLKIININVYGGNWLHILLKMTGSFACVVTSKECGGSAWVCNGLPSLGPRPSSIDVTLMLDWGQILIPNSILPNSTKDTD
jgi:hypothetical protein